MAAEKVQEELVEAALRMGQRSVPPRAQADWAEETTERGRVKTRACRETWLGADSEHTGT